MLSRIYIQKVEDKHLLSVIIEKFTMEKKFK